MTAALVRWLVLAAVGGEPVVAPAPPAGAPRGEVLFRRGVAAYDAHEYASAIEWFEKAYATDAEPAILFNIAQAYRALGDCPKALEKVEMFLETAQPGDPLVARARGKKGELEACAAASGGSEQKRVTPLASRRVATGTPPADLEEAPRAAPTLRLVSAPTPPGRPPFFQGATATTCAVSAGGALALGLSSLAFNIAASSLAGRVDDATTWTPEVAADDAQSRALGKAGVITAIAAGGLALFAGTSCAIRWSDLRGHRRPD
jgi:tetratricopeptide (TPR) repeat protein